MLVGQRLSARHISALLRFALLCFVIIADHYHSLIVIAAGFAV